MDIVFVGVGSEDSPESSAGSCVVEQSCFGMGATAASESMLVTCSFFSGCLSFSSPVALRSIATTMRVLAVGGTVYYVDLEHGCLNVW